MDIQKTCETYVSIPTSAIRSPLCARRGRAPVGRRRQGIRRPGSGIAVNIFGVSDPEWVEAVTGQLRALPHTSNLYYTEPARIWPRSSAGARA